MPNPSKARQLRVCMLVYNNCTRDARVLKEATTLTDAGHTVRILAVLDRGTEPIDTVGAVSIRRIDRDPIHYRILRLERRLRALLRAVGRRAVAGPEGASARSNDESPAEPRKRRSPSTLPRRAVMLFHKPLLYLDWYRRVHAAEAAAPADVYHAHDLNTLPPAALLAARTGAKLVYDAHELYSEVSTLGPVERRVWRVAERFLVRRADAVVAVCDSIAQELSARASIRKPTVLLNATELSRRPGGHGQIRLRDHAGAPPSLPIVLYQGGFVPHRGLHALVESAAFLDSAIVVLLGWGRLEASLKARVEERGLHEKVFFAPPVPRDQLVACSAQASIGVIPYEPVGLNNRYTAPNKLFEYFAAGIPVVGTHLPELIRFVEGLGTGRTFARAEPALIARTVNELLHDRAAYAEAQSRSRQAGDTYAWEREEQKLLAVYRELVA